MESSIFLFQLQSRLRSTTLQFLEKKFGEDFNQSFITDDLFALKSTEKKFGDFSSNIVLVLAKKLKSNPKDLGEQLVEQWVACSEVKSVNFVFPGFLNLVVTNEFKTSYFKSFCEENNFSSLSLPENHGKKIILEYVSANPTGPLHIGHGRWAVIGSILGNLLRTVGYEVMEEFYINDMGTQIEKLNESVAAVRSGKPVPEDGYHGEYIKDLIHEDDPKSTILEEQKKVLQSLGVRQENFVSEEKIRENDGVAKAMESLAGKGFIYENDGAVWFRSTLKGDDKDRVLVRSDGNYTYFAVDIAYHYDKITRTPNRLINILGADHHGYIKRIAAAVDILSEDTVPLDMVIGQLVSLLRDGKPVAFSKRTGNIVELGEVVEEIGADALRYFLSMRSMQSSVEFDLALAQEKSLENPIYYIQYANARICSVFEKADEAVMKPCDVEDFDFATIENDSSGDIFKKMLFFEMEIFRMAESYQVHHLNTYLYELATLFHRLYNSEKFIDVSSEEGRAKTEQYLFFLAALQKIFAECFSLLGITPMKKM